MRVLIPVDGSISCRNALDLLAARARRMQVKPEVTLINVQHPVPMGVMTQFGLDAVRAAAEKEAKGIFADLEGSLAVTELDPAEKIGFGARNLPREELLPRVGIEKRARQHDEARAPCARRVAPRPRESAARACRRRLQLRRRGSAIHQRKSGLLRTCAEGDCRERHARLWEEATEPVLDILRKADIEAEAVRLTGSPAEEITKYAKDHADMIVMGSHGWGRFKSAVLGSTATKIGALTHLPVLLIRIED